MAILKEFYGTRTDGVNLYRTYSNAGMMLVQNETGIEYSEAVDIESVPYTYSESENPIAEVELPPEPENDDEGVKL